VSKGRFLVPVFACLIASALALAACGSSENEEEKIVNAIETAETSSDPADCEATETIKLMEQNSDKEGKEALANCEEEASDPTNKAESVDVEEVEIEGEEATATVAFRGGRYDGQTLIINVVKEEGDWKLNEAESFKKLDREKLVGEFERGFEEEKDIEPELAECVIEGVEESSDSEVEELVLGGPEGFVEIAEECTQ
jgi:ABC-type glycerol-3-phosphate transport system substrate-binding protein